MNHSRSDHRAWMAAIAAVSAPEPKIEHVIGAAPLATGLLSLAVAVAVVQRERRICARSADPHTRTAARPPAGAPSTRVGPGDQAPVPSAPTRRPGDTRDARPAASAAPTEGVR